MGAVRHRACVRSVSGRVRGAAAGAIFYAQLAQLYALRGLCVGIVACAAQRGVRSASAGAISAAAQRGVRSASSGAISAASARHTSDQEPPGDNEDHR